MPGARGAAPEQERLRLRGARAALAVDQPGHAARGPAPDLQLAGDLQQDGGRLRQGVGDRAANAGRAAGPHLQPREPPQVLGGPHLLAPGREAGALPRQRRLRQGHHRRALADARGHRRRGGPEGRQVREAPQQVPGREHPDEQEVRQGARRDPVLQRRRGGAPDAEGLRDGPHREGPGGAALPQHREEAVGQRHEPASLRDRRVAEPDRGQLGLELPDAGRRRPEAQEVWRRAG
mmetsp:Transcript_41104/g.121895  ORF Transcript_41104/g.121895 Transcript_41104/m.121895 type:complete len:235 (+) Transcript_41104:754-1458(+)